MTAPVSNPRWVTAERACLCQECYDLVRTGDRMAIYIDRGIQGHNAARFQIRRHYCEPCGRLLEDSLTTTEEG